MRLGLGGTLVMLVFSIIVNAQTVFSGRVFIADTFSPLKGVNIKNLNTGTAATSDLTGTFSIAAEKNHVIVLSLKSYVTDTVVLVNTNSRDFALLPVTHQLSEVTILGARTKLGELRDMEFDGQTVVYQRDKEGYYKGGVAFRLSYWNKDSRKERQSMKRLKDYALQDEIDSAFNTAFISTYLPLSGQDLLDFRDLYLPSVKLYKSPGFNMIVYLNDSYKKFKSLPPDKRKLERLPVAKPTIQN